MNKSYLELIQFPTYRERYEYLKMSGGIGIVTFGSDRYLNQMFYHDPEWLAIRDRVIIRDNGMDLAIQGREIISVIYVHHINPITKDDVLTRDPKLFDLNNLICCSLKTHNAIHYGNKSSLVLDPIERKPNDTCPWK